MHHFVAEMCTRKKSHNASDKYPTMHHSVTEICTCVHISVTKKCIVGCGAGALWGLCNRSSCNLCSVIWEIKFSILFPRFSSLSTHLIYAVMQKVKLSLRWRHNELDGVSDHQPHDCLLNLLFRRRLKKASKLRVTGLCAGNSPGAGEFPAQKASNAENASTWWRHHVQAWRWHIFLKRQFEMHFKERMVVFW